MVCSTTKIATNLGVDVSTTGIAVCVRSRDGEEGFVSRRFAQRVRTTWHKQPAYDLDAIPALLVTLLRGLREDGWVFNEGGTIVFSVRQHDMVLLDRDRRPLGPAISWESSVAEAEAAALNANPAVVQEVGPVAARYVVPKAQWLLQKAPSLRDSLRWLCTTGDYIVSRLTGWLCLASSDGRSNGLVQKLAPVHAEATMTAAGLDLTWLQEVILSGHIVDQVRKPTNIEVGPWRDLAELLCGWFVGASFGDNHAGATGFLVTDEKTLCLSAGSSGTSTRLVLPTATLADEVLCMEYLDMCMLLDMLPRCCVAYDEWFATLAGKPKHAQIDTAALGAKLASGYLVELGADSEVSPRGWETLTPGRQAAHLQVSLALGMLQHTKAVLAEAAGAEQITRCFLTGGLAMSELFRHAIVVGVRLLVPNCQVFVSSLKGAGRFQMAARGAMIASMLPDDGGTVANLARVDSDLSPRVPCDEPGERQDSLERIMGPLLSD